MQWILDHSQLISAFTGVGTLLVWVIYLQVFVSSYRRQLRATLLITRGPGEGLAARCFVTNMSWGPLYVQSVLIALETPDRTIVMPATETQDEEQRAYARPLERTRQGPLQPAAIRDIGSFEHLMAPALRELPEGAAAVQAVTIVVLGVYGSEDLPVGARRRFVVTSAADRLRLHGATWIRNRSGRRANAGSCSPTCNATSSLGRPANGRPCLVTGLRAPAP